jgi:hypothetical protein
MLGAAGGDALLLWMLRGMPGDAWVRVHPSKMGSPVLGHPCSEVPPTLEFDPAEGDPGEREDTVGTLLPVLPPPVPRFLRSWPPESFRLWLEQRVRRRATSGRDRPELDPQIRQRLRKSYEPRVRRLADLIDRDLEDCLPSKARRRVVY